MTAAIVPMIGGIDTEVTIKGEAKEIAELVKEVQGTAKKNLTIEELERIAKELNGFEDCVE